MKYYAVKKGRKVGIYSSWEECKVQVNGFSDAKYKSFDLREDAEKYISDAIPHEESPEIEAYVDGSFNELLGKYSFGCVLLNKGEIVHTMCGCSSNSNYIGMRNVAGELEAAEQAIKWAINNHAESIRIYHDYEGISSWANGEWSANKQGTQDYVSFIKVSQKKIRIEFTKVKGHSGLKYNEMADELAKEGMNKVCIEDCTIKFQEFVKINACEESKFSFVIKNNIITEKVVIAFVKKILKEKKFKKVTNLKVQYVIDKGYLNVVFDANNVIQKDIKIRICD